MEWGGDLASRYAELRIAGRLRLAVVAVRDARSSHTLAVCLWNARWHSARKPF